MGSDQQGAPSFPAAKVTPAPDSGASALQPFSLSVLLDRLLAVFPGSEATLVSNPSPSAQHSLLLGAGHATDIARFLREDPMLRLDFCSNVTGVDWPDKGHLEVVYHLYSMALKHGPVIIRLRTANRTDDVTLPSLTPVWRSCEFQEREVFDLYGVVFAGHPDLRRILMWDEFKDHPMRRDYVEPDDYEWEPTAHGSVLEKTNQHRAPKAEGLKS